MATPPADPLLQLDPALRPLVQQAANAQQLPLALLVGQILVESAGDPYACRYEPGFFNAYLRGKSSAAGAAYGPFAACSVGLLQIMVTVACELGYAGRPEGLFDPATNLQYGTLKLRQLWNWAGGRDTDYVQALAAYNGGTGGNAHPPFRNQAYAERVYHAAGLDG